MFSWLQKSENISKIGYVELGLEEYVVVDLETTGLSPQRDDIVQIAAVRYRDHVETETYMSYVCPPCSIPQRATAVHGITDQMVAGCPPIEDIKEPFLTFLGTSVMVGYNIQFDAKFLEMAFAVTPPTLDVLKCAKKLLPNLPNHKLETVAKLAKYSGVSHNALADCRATAMVLKALCQHSSEHLEPYYPIFSAQGEQRTTASRSKRNYPQPLRPCNFAPSTIPTNTAHPFYGKLIVFTGALSIPRQEAMQAVVNLGALVRTTVSRKTDYLIVGVQDVSIVGDDGLSEKEVRAYALKDSGEAHILVIGEAEFMQLLSPAANTSPSLL